MTVKELVDKLSLLPLYNDNDVVKIGVRQSDGTIKYMDVEFLGKQPYIIEKTEDGSKSIVFHRDNNGTAIIFAKNED